MTRVCRAARFLFFHADSIPLTFPSSVRLLTFRVPILHPDSSHLRGFERVTGASDVESARLSIRFLGSIPIARCKLVPFVPIVPEGRLQRHEAVGLIVIG